MSAGGISIFYGAKDRETVRDELYTSEMDLITIAKFKNLTDLTILDLTKVEQVQVPSLFDQEKRKEGQAIIFLKKLSEYLTRSIDSMERIEYVPTQIVAEYFQHLVKYKGKSVNGIAFNSARRPGGICYALFFNHKECLEQEDDLYGLSIRQKLRMVPKSLVTYNGDDDS